MKTSFLWTLLFLLGCGGGLTLNPVVTVTEPPARVILLFSVDASGEPVTGLVQENFTVREDGRGEAPTTSWDLANPDLSSRQHTLLLLDLSGPMDENARMDVGAAAGVFVEQVDSVGRVALYAFGGSAKPHVLIPFTKEKPSIEEVVAKVTEFKDSDDSTDLHSSFAEAYAALRKKLEAETLMFGTLVVVARGPDRAGRVKRTEVMKVIRKAQKRSDGAPSMKIARHAIGIGELAKKASLSTLTSTSPSMVASTKELGGALDALAKRIVARGKSYYIVAYCSGGRAGKHSIRISAKRIVATPKGKATEQTGGFTHRFNADGFTAGCKPDIPAEWRESAK